MPFVITSRNEHHLRSETVASAAHGVDALNRCQEDGFKLVSILSDRYHKLSAAELRRQAIEEGNQARSVPEG